MQTSQRIIYKLHQRITRNSRDMIRIYLRWTHHHRNRSIAKSRALQHQPYRGDILARQNQCQFPHQQEDRNIICTLEQSRNKQGHGREDKIHHHHLQEETQRRLGTWQWQYEPRQLCVHCRKTFLRPAMPTSSLLYIVKTYVCITMLTFLRHTLLCVQCKNVH